jgi:hypothetical protein
MPLKVARILSPSTNIGEMKDAKVVSSTGFSFRKAAF